MAHLFKSIRDRLPPWLQHGGVQALLLLVVALWVHKQWVLRQYNNRPHPDAWYREPHKHREYIAGVRDFVEIYSSHMPKSREGGHNDVGYEDTGRFTRCVTTQIAVTTYYCGSEPAKSGEDHRRDSHTSGELVELLEELALPPEEAAESVLLKEFLGEGWDGERLPQLIFRCHMGGDIDVVGHTLVIAMQPSLRFDVFQSFIGAYSLEEYLEWEPRSFSYGDMLKWLDAVQWLEEQTVYTKKVDEVYTALFGASYARGRGYHGVKLGSQEGGKGPGWDPNTGTTGWELGQGEALKFQWGLPCIIPANASAIVQESK